MILQAFWGMFLQDARYINVARALESSQND